MLLAPKFSGGWVYHLKHEKLFDQKHESCEKVISVNLYIFVHCVIRFEGHGCSVLGVNLGEKFDITKYKSDKRQFKTNVV